MRADRDELILGGSAHIPANLLLVATAGQVANAHSGPPELRHQFRQASVRARCTAPLGHVKHVQQRLAADTLKAVARG
jgi:hypothetical protein